jgi:hypothetical protein
MPCPEELAHENVDALLETMCRARSNPKIRANSAADLGFEAKLWLVAGKRHREDVAVYEYAGANPENAGGCRNQEIIELLFNHG